MTSTTVESWFDDEGGSGAASAKLKDLGDAVKGTVVDQFEMPYVPFGKTEQAKDEKTGKPLTQLCVVLQTEYRNWERVAKVPTDKDGNPKPAGDDDGRRAIYSRKFTNINSALAAALRTAESKLLNGGELAVQFFDTEDTGKGNPLKKYRAKYTPPVATNDSEDYFGDTTTPAQPAQQVTPVQQAQTQPAPTQAAPSSPPADPWGTPSDEPPF